MKPKVACLKPKVACLKAKVALGGPAEITSVMAIGLYGDLMEVAVKLALLEYIYKYVCMCIISRVFNTSVKLVWRGIG